MALKLTKKQKRLMDFLEDFQNNRKIEHEGEQSSLQEYHPVGRCLKTG